MLVIPYIDKRAKVIAAYIEKHQGCPVDAIYSLRRKHLGPTKNKYYRYQQIFEDFEVNEEETLISSTLIIAAYNKEISDKTDLLWDFKSDENSFGI